MKQLSWSISIQDFLFLQFVLINSLFPLQVIGRQKMFLLIIACHIQIYSGMNNYYFIYLIVRLCIATIILTVIFLWPQTGMISFRSKKVIELGSGYGLAGFVIAAVTEASEVVISDGNPQVVDCILLL